MRKRVFRVMLTFGFLELLRQSVTCVGGIRVKGRRAL